MLLYDLHEVADCIGHTLQVDFMSEVDGRYKAALDEDDERELRYACDRSLKLDILLPLLKDYVIKNLVRVSQSDSRSVGHARRSAGSLWSGEGSSPHLGSDMVGRRGWSERGVRTWTA